MLSVRSKEQVASLAFVALGLFVLWADGPPIFAWIMIGLGVLGLLGFIPTSLYPPGFISWDYSGDSDAVLPKEGLDYRADVSDVDVVLTNLHTAEAHRMMWSDVASILAFALYNFPAGRINWLLLTSDKKTLEIPWDVQGNKELLAKMQDRFPDLDNKAIIESAGLLHGFRQVWPPASAGA